jgi:hypothetical protein
MTRRSKLWRWAAGLFIVINLAGAVGAAAMGERRHYDVHLGLLLLGVIAYLVWRAGPRGKGHDLSSKPQADQRLDYLQQSVDALALELERLGEAQRFKDKLPAERGESLSRKKTSEEPQ